jgi:hypothetical protein
MTGFDTCYGHRSDLAEIRRQNASRGGRTGGRGRGANNELRELKAAVRGVTDAVLSGEIKTAAGAVALQGMNTSLRALEIERRTFDVATLLERLELLEDRADRIKGASLVHGFTRSLARRLEALERRLSALPDLETDEDRARRLELVRAAHLDLQPEDLTAAETVTFEKIKATVYIAREIRDGGLVDDDGDDHRDLDDLDDDPHAPVWRP